MKSYQKYLLTGTVVLIAAVTILLKYWDYVDSSWTRDGQVRADVIQVTARVTGPIIHLPIKDNQLVTAGHLLFEIDPRTYKVSLDQARANYDETLDDIAALEKQVEASKASVAQFESAIIEATSALKAAKSQLRDAKVKFQRNQKLVAEGTISKQRFDDLKMQFEVAGASKGQSIAALLSANAVNPGWINSPW